MEVYSSPNHGPRRSVTKGVVVHSTRSGRLSQEEEYEITVEWFLNPSAQVSAHRVIGYYEGQHAQLVDDDLEAWAARDHNTTHLQVELCQPLPSSPFSDYQYKTLAALCAHWARKYGFPLDRDHIRGHDEIPPGIREGKSDPGSLFDWDKLLALVSTLRVAR